MLARSAVRPTPLLALLTLAAAGCGGSGAVQEDAAAAPDAGAQYDAAPQHDAAAPSTDAAAPTTYVSLLRSDFATGALLAGVECCLEGTATCGTSGASGVVRIDHVPQSAEVAIVCHLSGYVTDRTLLTVGAESVTNSLAMFSATLLDSWSEAAATTRDSSKAFVFVQGSYVNTPLAGITFTLTPASGVGPVYFNASGEPDPSVTGTESAPYAIVVNVEPGDYVFAAAAPGGCSFLAPHGWAGPTADTLRLGAPAGMLSHAFLKCQ